MNVVNHVAPLAYRRGDGGEACRFTEGEELACSSCCHEIGLAKFDGASGC